MLGSMDIDKGFAFAKLYFARIALINSSWDTVIVRASWFQVTFMPRSQLIDLRSVILNHEPISFLNAQINSDELPVIVQSSTCDVNMRISELMRIMKMP